MIIQALRELGRPCVDSHNLMVWDITHGFHMLYFTNNSITFAEIYQIRVVEKDIEVWQVTKLSMVFLNCGIS